MPFSSFSQAEITLTERARLDRPLMWTVWLAAATFSLAGGQWFYLAAATFGVAVNMLAVRRAKEVYVHKLFVNLGLVAATAILAIEIFAAKLVVLQALGHYLILLQLCKLFQHKGNRDYTQILALSALLMIATTMVTVDLWFGLALVAYLALLCYTTMIFTLKRGLDAVVATKLPTEPTPADVSRIAWNVGRFWPAGAIRKWTALAMLVVLAFGVIAFLVTPRLNDIDPALAVPSPGVGGLLGGTSAQAAAGFSQTVILGDVSGMVSKSTVKVMTVRVRAPAGGTISATTSYIRGKTYNEYHDSQWFRSRIAARPLSGIHPPRQLLKGAMQQQITMDRRLLPVYFGSYPTVAIGGGKTALLQYDMSVASARRSASPLVRYTAYVLPSPLSPAARQYLAAIRSSYGVALPGEPGRTVQVPGKVTDLARRWCADLLDKRRRRPEMTEQIDLQIAARIAEMLRKNYSYTLDLTGVNPEIDGVEDFLFNMKRGHCEYFASALAVMCRKLAVDARLATGFVMSEYDPAQKNYVVRGRDAHAWVEVFTPSTDWVIFDPTPPGGLLLHKQVWGVGIRQWWNDLRFQWYDKVVGYDASVRRRLLQSVLNDLAQIRTSFKNLVFRGVVDWALVRMMLVIGTIGLFIEGLLIRRWIRLAAERRRQDLRAHPISPRHISFIRELLKFLAGRGMQRKIGQTLGEFADQSANSAGIPRGAVRYVVELYYRIRWGRHTPSAAELRTAQQCVDEIRTLWRKDRQDTD